MEGVRVGNRMIGTQSPVTVGWENLPKVEGGPIKRHFFTWFQPAALFALIAFWYYAPNSIATASTAIGIGIGFIFLICFQLSRFVCRIFRIKHSYFFK